MTTPNVYHLHGHGLSVGYSTGEGGSMHSFEYQDAHQYQVFRDDQIDTTQSPIGTLVTVTLRLTVDSGSTSFTLLVPNVNLSGPGVPVQITTEGITTVHRFSIAPSLLRGQLELYTFTTLRGTAEFMPF